MMTVNNLDTYLEKEFQAQALSGLVKLGINATVAEGVLHRARRVIQCASENVLLFSLLFAMFVCFPTACNTRLPAETSQAATATDDQDQQAADLDRYMGPDRDQYYEQRKRMLRDNIMRRGISDPFVLQAMGRVQRHLFVTDSYVGQAYADHPLPIDEGQTISQPYVVALMTEAIAIRPGDRVLEIGTGSGYQAAVLAEITDEVFSIEIKEALTGFAQDNLTRAGYENVQIMHGDGYFGWEQHAPFDAIIVTCAANHISPHLLQQLKDGGRLVIPLGDTTYFQTLTLIEKDGDDLVVTHMADVAFVPMTGEAMK
jgi:protein-L-isoaspartate(D-aspartate) O-methyltransferase